MERNCSVFGWMSNEQSVCESYVCEFSMQSVICMKYESCM